MAFVNKMYDVISTGQYHMVDKGSNSNWNRLHIKTKLYLSISSHILDNFDHIEGLYIINYGIISPSHRILIINPNSFYKTIIKKNERSTLG